MRIKHQILYFVLFVLPFIFLPYSKALISISVGLLLLFSLVHVFLNSISFRKDIILFLSFSLYFALSFLAVFSSQQIDSAWQKILLKLPILFVPFLLVLKRDQKIKWFLAFEVIYIALASFIALLSTINYFLHKEALDFMVLQNKPIPVIADIYHIEFSVILAISILICIYRLLFFHWSKSFWQIAYIIGLIIGTIAIHIMAVRTGLLALYVGIASLGLIYMFTFKKYKFFLWSSVALFILVCGTYFGSRSFRNRVKLTLDDISVLTENRDRNWHSVSMRFEAFGNGIDVFKKNPWVGVGLGDVDVSIQNQFVLNKTKLKPVNRKKPHNQFLENAIQSGVFTPIVLLIILLIPIFMRRYRNPLAIAFIVSIFFAMQFESILERQSTVIVFCLLYAHVVALNTVTLKSIDTYKKE